MNPWSLVTTVAETSRRLWEIFLEDGDYSGSKRSAGTSQWIWFPRHPALSAGEPANPNPGFHRAREGFILVFFTFLLPPLVLALTWVALRLSQLVDLRHLRETCRLELTRGQEAAREKIELLLGLNTVVRALKLERKAAEIAVLVAPDPMEKAAALRWLSTVKLRQGSTRTQQRLLILEGERALVEAQLRFLREARRWSSPEVNARRVLHQLSLWKPDLKPLRLAVRPKDISDEFPEYELKPRFSEAQAVVLKWLVHSSIERKGGVPWRKFQVPDTCGVTLIERGAKLHLRLIQDRFFWNY